ncbi:MAG: DUF1540 domain-containing protein [Bacillota bacterium]|nr:DUF1540 domain-containing protein [Bacillota bacterium]
MANKDIRCTVETCHYWANKNYCAADQILVTADSVATDTSHTLNALQASTISPTPVGKCQETCCKTFIEKGKQDAYHEGIKKMQ